MKQPTKVVKTKSSNRGEAASEKSAKEDLVGIANYKEREGNLDEAAKVYETIIKYHPANEYSYNRLMMIYRKKKDYKNELRVINEGIKVFRELYTPSSAGKNRNVIKLSRQLSMVTGLTDKKGKSLYDAEPIGKWKKRKQVVLKKLGKI